MTTQEPGEGWPFDESPEVAVFVTEEVLQEGLPVLWAMHDGDGDWLFGSVRDFDVQTSSQVPLAYVAATHPGVASVADLPPGWIAERDSPESDWLRQEMDAS
ncbi:MAG: hypothetical protein H0T70_05520 [Acidimicrobiia bacterium]|nr:hypothetical protein [Acidimicrobiia bacterium]